MNLTLKYLVCFIAFLSSFESQSQNFINPGAEWNSSGYVVDGASFTEFINYKYQNDTTIQGLTYQIIKKKGKSIHYFPSIAVSEYSLGSFLLRSSGDSLFYSRIDSVEEHLLYDFSPVIGNTWDVFPILEGIFYPPTTSQLVQTTGFGDTLINGHTVNWVEVVSLNPDSLYFNGRIYNHMGYITFLPFWFEGIADIHPFMWSCYKDDILGEYNSCTDFETLGIENIDHFDLKLITNSKNNFLVIDKIDSLDIDCLVIYDLMGRQVIIKEKINSNQVDLFLPSGIYICNITIGRMNYSQKFLW